MIPALTSVLQHELAIAVNFDKCAVGLRTDTFVRYCERHLSEPTAGVYSALLHILEDSISRCYDPLRPKQEERKFFEAEYQQPSPDDISLSQPISTREIANVLDAYVDLDQLASELEDDIALSIEGATAHAGTATSLTIEEDGTLPLALRLQKVQQHLGTLCCDPHGYVQTIKGEWSVPFHAVTQRIIENEIESMITQTLGTLAARMIRVLKYYGHQELKHLASRAMVTEDQARTACTSLQQAGWIEIVELPRTARREVTKSMWLWSYDVLKARQKCLADCYFAMSRLSVRLQHKRQDIQRVVDKSERTDVQGNEDKFLNQEEKEVLAKFRKQTDIVIRQLIRMDELVAIMRDFSPMEYPHKLWDPSWTDWCSSSRDGSDAKAEDDETEGDGGLDDFNDDETADA
jgi:DNA-directed RNA polymerase III subunit RPC3